MTEATAALLGAAIGSVAGLAGGGFAALASLRASQVAARAPLAEKLHLLGTKLVKLRAATGTSDEMEARRNVELAWNDFATHQRILCPSKALDFLVYLIRRTTTERHVSADALLTIGGQAQGVAARIVAAHSNRLFRRCAVRDELSLLGDWLVGDARGLLSDEIRKKIAVDLQLPKRFRKQVQALEKVPRPATPSGT